MVSDAEPWVGTWRQAEAIFDPAPPRTIRFTVIGTPATQGSKVGFVNKKTNRVVVKEHTDARTRTWRSDVVDAARTALGDGRPLDGPVALDVTFRFARPAGHYGTGRNRDTLKASAPARPSAGRRYDLDKLQRAVLDALSDAKVIYDDCQVVDITASKHYTRDRAQPEGAAIILTEL